MTDSDAIRLVEVSKREHQLMNLIAKIAEGGDEAVETMRVWRVIEIINGHQGGPEAALNVERELEALADRHLLERLDGGYTLTPMGWQNEYWWDKHYHGMPARSAKTLGWTGIPIPNHVMGWVRPTGQEFRRSFVVTDDETARAWWQDPNNQ